jgi:8-amino-7-oxononanoate synthase
LNTFNSDWEQTLHELEKSGTLRKLRTFDGHGLELHEVERAEVSGDFSRALTPRLINFSSNDYLGFSTHSHVIEKSIEAIKKYGTGSGASRLVTGGIDLTSRLEQRLAKFKETQSALIFSSGYMANLGVMGVLADGESEFFFDRLAHASLIDGVLHHTKNWQRFRHNDVAHLESLLKKSSAQKKIVITESVFSMEGDLAPLEELAKLCGRFEALLYVDEAHATGVFGDKGQGLSVEKKISHYENVIVMGTFGKALGGSGAYVASSKLFRDWCVNKARTFIFSTALPPGVLGGVDGALDILEREPGLGKRLLAKARDFKSQLLASGLTLVPGDSQIISVLTRDNAKTLDCAKKLFENGLLMTPIRPPTVPLGEARLRLTVHLNHSVEHLKKAVQDLSLFCLDKKK